MSELCRLLAARYNDPALRNLADDLADLERRYAAGGRSVDERNA